MSFSHNLHVIFRQRSKITPDVRGKLKLSALGTAVLEGLLKKAGVYTYFEWMNFSVKVACIAEYGQMQRQGSEGTLKPKSVTDLLNSARSVLTSRRDGIRQPTRR